MPFYDAAESCEEVVKMPFGDGTGPKWGGGPGSGRRMGRGRGMGGGNRPGSGPGGFCVCPECGYRTPHTAGNPCYQMTCPSCGAQLIKE